MTMWLCWHQTEGCPERGDEIDAPDAPAAAWSFAELSQGGDGRGWTGGTVSVHRLDEALDGVGETVEFKVEVSPVDFSISVVPNVVGVGTR